MDDTGETLAGRTHRLLVESGRRPRRSRGQSFLVDPKVADRIVGIVSGHDRPKVLEIGAGLGALTDGLVRCSSQVVALELEEAFASALERLYAGHSTVSVVCGDALQADMARLCGSDTATWRVAGNLPYYAASAILLRVLAVSPPFDRAVLTVQREVGERLIAVPGKRDYGSLTVLVSYYCERVKAVARVSRGAFYPQPKVDSTVLLLQPRRERPKGVKCEALLFAAIRAGFGHRRKQIANALVGAGTLGPVDCEAVREALVATGVGEKARAQELALDDFIGLSNALWEDGVRPVASA